tara:strand:- start:438 stop:683 length:246 start_codon:yes stop_codon:yes gene_type:complete
MLSTFEIWSANDFQADPFQADPQGTSSGIVGEIGSLLFIELFKRLESLNFHWLFLPPLTTIFTGLTYPYAYILFPLIIEGR